MMIAPGGPFNNISYVVKPERTSDFLLWCCLIEVLANDWDAPNSSVLKSTFERVNRKTLKQKILVGLWVKNFTFSTLVSLKLNFSTTVFGST